MMINSPSNQFHYWPVGYHRRRHAARGKAHHASEYKEKAREKPGYKAR